MFSARLDRGVSGTARSCSSQLPLQGGGVKGHVLPELLPPPHPPPLPVG